MKKNIVTKLTVFLSVFCIAFFARSAVDEIVPNHFGVKGYILLDAKTGRVLAGYNYKDQLEPASITKLMTAYVIYELLDGGYLSLDNKFTVSKKARQMEGSRMFLEEGSKVSIDDLLQGLVVQSGNDAAITLAEGYFGDEYEFVNEMNKAIEKLGLTDTHFMNATGLPEDGHYSTAYDIAKIAQAIIKKFPTHYDLYKEKEFTWNGITQHNRNGLIDSDPTVDGLKTGHTQSAGYCLVASAKRGDRRLISVVLGAKSTQNRENVAEQILNYGFKQYHEVELYKNNAALATAPVRFGKNKTVDIGVSNSVSLLIKKGEEKQVSAKLVLDQNPLVAPIKKGQVVGKIVISQAGNPLREIPAITLNEDQEVGFFIKLWRRFVAMVLSWF